MGWVVNGENLLALGPPCILVQAFPWDLHLLSLQMQHLQHTSAAKKEAATSAWAAPSLLK